MTKKIIGFCGPTRAGKNTAGEVLENNGWLKYEMSFLMRYTLEECLGYTLTDAEYETFKDIELVQGRTYRDFYIGIGKMLRTQIDSDIIAKHMENAMLATLQNFYVPNIRLVPEANKILKAGGIIIEVLNPNCKYDSIKETETRLPDSLITHAIVNNGTKQELYAKVLDIVETL